MTKIHKVLTILLCVALWQHSANAQTGNVGIGNNNPVTRLDVAGDLALREGTAINVSGANPTVPISLHATNAENSFYRITGSPTGTMALNTIANGVDGQIITLVNATTIKLKIKKRCCWRHPDQRRGCHLNCTQWKCYFTVFYLCCKMVCYQRGGCNHYRLDKSYHN